DSKAFGEDWILTANKGARAFIAHSAFGFVAALQQYSNFFYTTGFANQDFLTRGIGDVQREVSRQFLAQSSQSIQAVTQVQQMVLLGDPAVKLFGTALPDFAISNTGVGLVSLDGNPVTALSHTFGVRFIVRNRGAATSGKLPVRLTRQLPNNSTVVYDSLFAGVSFRDTLVFVLPREEQGSGNNRFTVVLDPAQQFTELEENNNTAVFEALIPLSSTRNLLPAPYGIANQPLVEFVFQNANTTAGSRVYRWEMDTVATFDSPYKKQLIIQGSPLVTQTFGVQTADSVVYYWRTRFDQPLPTESADWAVSSFTFISNGAPGWAQLEFEQLGENSTVGLVQDPAIKGLRFAESTASVFVRTFGSDFPSPSTDVSFKVNGSEYNLSTQGQPCRNNTINLVAFNKSALVPYAPVPLNFQDPRTCGREPQVINSYLSSEREAGSDDLSQAITNTALSDSVILFSIGDAAYSTWTTGLKLKLQEIGVAAGQLSSLVDGEPVVILGRKGAPAGTARLFRAAAPATAGEVLVSEELTGRVTTGAMTSVLVGPAAAWQEFIPFVEDREAFDQVNFSISGVSLTGSESPLLNGVTGRRNLSVFQAADYPYVRVTYLATDEVNLTPAQLRWMVTYTPVPEGVLLPGRNATASPRVVAEGQTVAVDYRFVNVSSYAFPDSLTVNAGLRNPLAGADPVKTFRIKPPAPRDTSSFSVSWSTLGQAGENDVWAWVNNRVLPELAYDNNILDRQRYLRVERDKLPPVLDVTFDGRYLRNGDLVSASPTVLMTLIDENPFLLKQDTIGFQMWLSSPCSTGVCVRQIYFSQPGVSWQSASTSTPFHVSLQPVLMPGAYTLRVVARDASGNTSGTEPYEITFWVEEGTAFELKSVSPNPSATDVLFEFLLKGQDVPDEFSLEIFAPDGRKVHNFGDAEVANFFIGTNRLVWQTAGLPAGVYLFRLSFRVGGNPTVTTGRVVKL
ncbi:MAG: C25 family cysteine peptidase, partial [Cyclobacteriaceae bacterium]